MSIEPQFQLFHGGQAPGGGGGIKIEGLSQTPRAHTTSPLSILHIHSCRSFEIYSAFPLYLPE